MTDNEYRKMYDKDPRKAQTALFDEYLGYVYAIVYNKLRSCGSSEDIEECVGDVFSAVFISYDRRGSFDGEAADAAGRRTGTPKKFPETAQSGMYLESQYPSLFYRRGVYGITRFQCRSLSSGRRTGGPAVFI